MAWEKRKNVYYIFNSGGKTCNLKRGIFGRPDMMKNEISGRIYNLRKHPEAVAEYGKIKTEGALKFPYDMDGYIAYKSDFIERIYERIGVNNG